MARASLVAGSVFSAACALAGPLAEAQEFPSKPLRIIVANSPGTSPDISMRLIAPEMSKTLGQPVVVETKPGASGMVAWEYVVKQVPADGYTIAQVTVPSLAALPVTFKELRFNPLTDLPPVMGVAETKLVFGSSAESPWTNFNELIAHARKNPGKLNYGSSSITGRLNMEALISSLGITVVHVPYPGGGPLMKALTTSEIHMAFGGALEFSTDKLRTLAVTGDQRRAPHLDIPTFAELGYPQIKSVGFSINLAAGTPRVAFEKIRGAAARALQQPDVRAGYAKIRLDVVDQSPEEAAKTLTELAKLYADIARKVGMQPQ